jgi:lipopolysaccharide/colanic/teichoic acid biosynthesis glycosyltransferase
VPTMAMERAQERPPDVARANERLTGSRARVRLAAKRALDFVLALTMLAALAPLVVVAALLRLTDDDGWFERRERVGRDGRPLALWRFRPLPGPLGRALERIGVRDVPMLIAVLGGRMSLVGPRALPPEAGETAAMTPGLIGPAQRWATDADTASELDAAYVRAWTLRGDLRLLTWVRCRPPVPVRR